MKIEKKMIPIQIPPKEITELSDGFIIQQDENVHLINPSGMEIYKLCNGIRTIGNIFEVITKKYPNEEINECIENYFTELFNAGLIKINNE